MMQLHSSFWLVLASLIGFMAADVSRSAMASEPAGSLRVTVVDAEGTHLPWLYFRIRLEALDGRALVPPDKPPHLPAFPSPVWTASAEKGIFTFTQLPPGDYSIDVIDLRSTQMSYHGRLSPVHVRAGELKEVQVGPATYHTSLTVEIPSPRDERPEMRRSFLVISQNPGLVLWADGKLRSEEDPRLGRIVQRALIANPVSPGAAYQVKNLPPGVYSIFVGPSVCLRGVKVEVVPDTPTTADIRWSLPAPGQAGNVRLSRLDRRIRLEAGEYTANELCQRITAEMESLPRFSADPSIQDVKVRCPTHETAMWDLLEHVFLATGWQLAEQDADAMILRPAPEPPPTGSLAGRVLSANDRPVAGACVFICDQADGAPLSRRLDQTLFEAYQTSARPTEFAFTVSDYEGQFAFDGLRPGEYRLVAQSWKDPKSIEGLLEVNGPEITLHGVAEHVKVAPETPATVAIRPLGTGTLLLDEQMPNDETFLFISTEPPRADPILGFVGWGGPFLKYLIGGNRMPRGRTLVHGLPEGVVYVALFAANNVPGFGSAEAKIKSRSTTVAYVPIVAGWSDGHHDPPLSLVPLCEEVKSLLHETNTSVDAVLERHGIRLKRGDMIEASREISRHLAKPITLPTGRKTTVADFLAAVRYVELQQYVEQRKQQAQRARQMTQAERSVPNHVRQGRYADSLLDLYRELGRRYPCFELKRIDWKAVGEELLPRIEEAKTDEQFGLLCMELVARLEDSHAFVGPGTATPPTPPYPQWDPGYACLVDELGKPVVYYVDQDGPAEAAGVEVGMTVVSLGGKPAGKAIEECAKQISRYQGYSSRRFLQYQAFRWFVRQMERGAKVSVTMQEVGGRMREFELPATLDVRYLPRLPVPIAGISDSANVSWKILDKGIGYIYVRRIRGDLIEKLDQAVGVLKDAKGLVIDVRGNSGGGFDAERSHRNFAPDDPQEPQRPRFRGPMALLIDARCISAGEGWASWFVANRRARLFGQATAGASARKTSYPLKNGLYRVTFPIKAYRGFLDRPIERRGLEPDVPVMPNAADLAAGRDTVLENAKDYLLHVAIQERSSQ